MRNIKRSACALTTDPLLQIFSSFEGDNHPKPILSNDKSFGINFLPNPRRCDASDWSNLMKLGRSGSVGTLLCSKIGG